MTRLDPYGESFPSSEDGSIDPRYGVSAARGASLLGVSLRSVRYARKVLKHGIPELRKAAERGELAISTAAKQAMQPPEAQREYLRSKPEERKRVYLAVSADRFKVGVSELPTWRVESLKTGAPDLVLDCSAPGGTEKESEIHAKLAAFSVGGEWFRRTDESLQIARALVQGVQEVNEQ